MAKYVCWDPDVEDEADGRVYSCLMENELTVFDVAEEYATAVCTTHEAGWIVERVCVRLPDGSIKTCKMEVEYRPIFTATLEDAS